MIVSIITGHGLKDPDHAIKSSSEPLVVESNYDSNEGYFFNSLMNKSLLTTFFKFGLAGVVFGYIFISYSFKIPIVNQKVQCLIEEELTRSFDQKVTIESLEGTPFSTVLLSNVRIENTASYNISVMADIQRVNVHLNLPSILINKEFSQGLYRMDIDGVT